MKLHGRGSVLCDICDRMFRVNHYHNHRLKCKPEQTCKWCGVGTFRTYYAKGMHVHFSCPAKVDYCTKAFYSPMFHHIKWMYCRKSQVFLPRNVKHTLSVYNFKAKVVSADENTRDGNPACLAFARDMVQHSVDGIPYFLWSEELALKEARTARELILLRQNTKGKRRTRNSDRQDIENVLSREPNRKFRIFDSYVRALVLDHTNDLLPIIIPHSTVLSRRAAIQKIVQVPQSPSYDHQKQQFTRCVLRYHSIFDYLASKCDSGECTLNMVRGQYALLKDLSVYPVLLHNLAEAMRSHFTRQCESVRAMRALTSRKRKHTGNRTDNRTRLMPKTSAELFTGNRHLLNL